jgi:hypothetical protein
MRREGEPCDVCYPRGSNDSAIRSAATKAIRSPAQTIRRPAKRALGIPAAENQGRSPLIR